MRYRHETSGRAGPRGRAWPTGGRKAFSLVEMMIAVGILGVGLIYSAALFATAVKENETSANNAMGTIICKNALAMARVRLRDGDIVTTFGVIPAAKLGSGDLAYPVNTPSPTRGCIVLGKRMTDDKDEPINDYLLVFVACHMKAGHGVAAYKLTGCTVGADQDNFTAAGHGQGLKAGSPVIAPSGKYAWIKTVSGDKVYLNRPIDTENNVDAPFVIVEKDGAGIYGTVSPAMWVFGTRTGLQKE